MNQPILTVFLQVKESVLSVALKGRNAVIEDIDRKKRSLSKNEGLSLFHDLYRVGNLCLLGSLSIALQKDFNESESHGLGVDHCFVRQTLRKELRSQLYCFVSAISRNL